jgi:membrane protease YdiL (CAAX protease family)
VTDHPALVAIGIFVAYTVLVAVLWRVNGVRYDAIAESRGSVVRGIVVPIGLGGVLLAVATTWLGWWHPVLVQEHRAAAWTLVVPVLVGLVGLLGALNIDYRSEARGVLPWLAVGVLIVGFSEEMLARGILIVGGRDSGWSELVVVLVSCALQATVQQIVFATVMGASFYAIRMSTGTLIVCMLTHALWDFATLGQTTTGRGQKPAVGFLALATFAVGLVAAGVIVATS